MQTKNRKKAVIYCRVSSDKQATQGSGLESQEKRCRDYCQAQGYEVSRVFQDSFTGGGDFMQRPAMRDLLEYLEKNNHADYSVVFDDIKRLARDTVAHLKLRQEFGALNARVECPTFNFEDSPEGAFVETILAAQGELERKQNARQVVQKQKARLERGLWSFVAPKGYKTQADTVYGKICVPDSKKATALKEALEGYANKRFFTIIEATRFLQEHDYYPDPNKPAEKYVEQTKKAFKNIFYAGYIEYPKWEVKRIKAVHEPLIDLNTFNTIQERLNGRKVRRGKERKDYTKELPLRGLLLCSGCNHKLTGYRSRGRKPDVYYNYYACKINGCPLKDKTIKAEEAYKKYEAELLKLKATSGMVNFVTDLFHEAWEKELGRINLKIDSLHSKVDSLAESMARIESAVLDNKTPERMKDSLNDRYEKEANQKEQIEEKLAKGVDTVTPLRNETERVLGMFTKPLKIWTLSNPAQRTQLFSMFFDEFLTYDHENGFRNTKNPVCTRFFEQMEVSPLFMCTRRDSNPERRFRRP